MNQVKFVKNLLPIFLFLFSLQSCAQNNPNSVSVNKLKEKINNNDSSFVILDVRTNGEISGPLPIINGAVHIPVQELEGRIAELEIYKTKEILVICRTQNRSSAAAQFLNQKGFTAKSVTGGMTEFYKK